MKKSIVFLSALLLAATSLWCEKWYVCLTSMTVKGSAVSFQAELKKAGYRTFIKETTVRGNKYYRVLLDEGYDNAKDAEERCKDFESNTFSLRNKLKGLWIVHTCPENISSHDDGKKETAKIVLPAEPEKPAPSKAAPTATKKTEEPIVLQKNDELPVSEEKPYSVRIQTYREEQAAEDDRERLVKKDIDAYVLKKIDRDDSLRFDLQAGAFDSQEEAEDFKEELKDMRIKTLDVTDYNEYADELCDYDDAIATSKIVFDSGINEIPNSIPEDVKICINQFPVNKDFQIDYMRIYDMDELKNAGRTDGFEFGENVMPGQYLKDTSAFSYVSYTDNLFHKAVSVTIAVNENNSYEDFIRDISEEPIIAETDFDLPYGKLHSYISLAPGWYSIQGITEDKKMYVQMIMHGFTEEETVAFVENAYSDSTLLFYPQIRKSLCIIPEKNDDDSFLFFTFNKVGEDYAEEKGYADWANKIVGHWKSGFYLSHKEEVVSVGLFDLDYDYNANSVHRIFMEEKGGVSLKGNHYSNVNETDGWYIENFNGNELSFSLKSYIIAINSGFCSPVQEQELKSLADQLKIWK